MRNLQNLYEWTTGQHSDIMKRPKPWTRNTEEEKHHSEGIKNIVKKIIQQIFPNQKRCHSGMKEL